MNSSTTGMSTLQSSPELIARLRETYPDAEMAEIPKEFVKGVFEESTSPDSNATPLCKKQAKWITAVMGVALAVPGVGFIYNQLQAIDRANRVALFEENKKRAMSAIIAGEGWVTLKDSAGKEESVFLGTNTYYHSGRDSSGRAFMYEDRYETRGDGAVMAARQEIERLINNGSLVVTPDTPDITSIMDL